MERKRESNKRRENDGESESEGEKKRKDACVKVINGLCLIPLKKNVWTP